MVCNLFCNTAYQWFAVLLIRLEAPVEAKHLFVQTTTESEVDIYFKTSRWLQLLFILSRYFSYC